MLKTARQAVRQIPADTGDVRESGQASLTERLRAGDSDAAHEFYARYAPRIHRFILHSLGAGSEHDAEDIVQDTFIALAEALPFFRGDSSLFTFACAIAHRKVMTFFRTRARRRQLTMGTEPVTESVAPEAAEHRDQDLHRALAMLRQEYREVLILKYVEEATVADIAAILKVSEHAVESRLARARRALEKLLQ